MASRSSQQLPMTFEKRREQLYPTNERNSQELPIVVVNTSKDPYNSANEGN